jgi:hypothetical protein
MEVENKVFRAQIRSEEAKEVLTAFLEERVPDFTRVRNPAGPQAYANARKEAT